jgi:hypothetical protein
VSDFFWQFSIDENLDQGLPGLVRVLPREWDEPLAGGNLSTTK